METAFVGNPNIVEVKGVKNAATGLYINDATINMTLLDSAGVEITGQSWPTTLTYVVDSDGVYQGTILAAAALIAGEFGCVSVVVSGTAAALISEDVEFIDRTQ